jgi:hypothetical protein
MISSLDKDYSEMMAAAAAAKVTEEQGHIAAGVIPQPGMNWGLYQYQYDGRPYIKASCSHCKQIWTTGQLELTIAHCGRVDSMPEDLRDRLEALKIKLGINVQSFVQKIIGGSSPAPVKPGPSLASF